jgi:hypothetical protein
MNKFLLKLLFIGVLFVGILMSCKRQTVPCILTEQPFEDVLLKAGNEQKYFCILLTDSLQNSALDLLNRRLSGEFQSLAGKAIFNVIDIRAEKNQWYEK